MRILNLACFGVTLLACGELPATALDTKNITESDNSASSFSKTEFIAQNHWDTKASLLIAQGEDNLEAENQQVADSSWSSDSEQVDSEPTEVLFGLQQIQNSDFAPSRGAPGFTLANPTGFGADRGNAYVGFGFTPNSRNIPGFDLDDADAIVGFGIGLGDARQAVALELNYTLASLGFNRDFGTGGFNAKLHRTLTPGWGLAVGYNGFFNIGDGNDFEDSVYLSTTRIFSTRKNLNSAFSRVALTAGIGNGLFRTEDAINNDEEGFNPFASLAFRIARPVSGIIEWTGQDLAVAASVSPFRSLPVTLNIGLRDIAGAGDGARLAFGIGAGF